jgi:type II secretion system protein N
MALTLAFALLLFPWSRFEGAVTRELAAATGARVEIGALETGLGWGGPALVTRELSLRWPDGTRFDLDRAALRPAWSLSWLRGDAALHVDLLSAEMGHVVGTVWPAGGPAFDGTARELDLEALPRAWMGGRGAPVAGRVDADLDLAAPDGRIRGHVRFDSRDGLLVLPDSPIAIPYTRLQGELERSQAGETTVHQLDLEGPMISLAGTGTLGAAPAFEHSPLDLEVTLRGVDQVLQGWIRPLGVSLDASGNGRFRVGGTIDRPRLRPR